MVTGSLFLRRRYGDRLVIQSHLNLCTQQRHCHACRFPRADCYFKTMTTGLSLF